jgi:PST family polysaccharide transporter
MILKKLRNNVLLKVLSLNSFSVGIGFVLGIVSTKIVSVFLGPSGMTLLGSFRNFTSMNKSIATLGINNSLIKLFVENKNDKKELAILYSTFFWIFLFVSVFVGGITLVFANDFSDLIFFNSAFANPIRFFALLLPLVVVNAFWLSIYNGLEQFNRIVLIQIISNILIFGLTTFLIWRKNITGGLYAIALGELVMFLVTFLFVIKDKSQFKFDLQKVIDNKYYNVIKKFSVMALLSAFIVPLALIFIRNFIVKTHSIQDAGIWDATNKISSFYMTVLSSGLSLYYMPKLASLETDSDFRIELKSYFKIFVPLFFLMLVIILLFKDFLLNMVFTKDFIQVKEVLIWQLLGDLFRVMTLAFGYQIVVKSRMKDYFIIELVFNSTYLILSFYLVKIFSFEGALQSYFYASLVTFILILFMFRKLFIKR